MRARSPILASARRRTTAAAFGAAILIGCGLSAPPAQAAYIVTLTQEGSNVVANGSGTIDLSGLNFLANNFEVAGIEPSEAAIVTGPASGEVGDYTGATGPTSFGSGGFNPVSSGSGDIVAIGGVFTQILLPPGYVSGASLSDTSTYDNATFASLGVTPGTYVWTWGTAGDDSFTLDVGVPEPSSLLLFALPLGFLMLLAARRRVRAPAATR